MSLKPFSHFHSSSTPVCFFMKVWKFVHLRNMTFLYTGLYYLTPILLRIFCPIFFYSRIHSRIFSSLNHKIRELMPPKRESSPNLYYYIYTVTPFCLASLNMLKDIYSGKGNMVTRLYSGINIITVNPIPVWKITHLLSNVRCSALFKVLTL